MKLVIMKYWLYQTDDLSASILFEYISSLLILKFDNNEKISWPHIILL